MVPLGFRRRSILEQGLPSMGGELQDKDVTAFAVSMEWDLSAWAIPGCIASPRQINVSAPVRGNARAVITTA